MRKKRQPEGGTALRLGFIIKGKIQAQHVIHQDGPVYIEDDLGPKLRFKTPTKMEEAPLFSLKTGQVYLIPRPGLVGKLSKGGRVEPLLTSPTEGKRLALKLGDRGKLQLEDATLLFQVIPKEMAPGEHHPIPFLWRFDRVMLQVLILSLFCHLSFVFYVQALERPPEQDLVAFRQIVDRFPIVVLKRPDVEEKKPKPAPPLITDREWPHRSKPEKEVQAKKEERTIDVVKKEVKEEAQAWLKKIGSRGRHGKGTELAKVEILLNTKSEDLEKFLKSGRKITTKPTGGLQAGTGGPTLNGPGDSPQIAMTDVDVRKRKAPPPQIDHKEFVTPPDLKSDDLSNIKRTMSKYLAGITACHTKSLNKNPKVGGRVVVGIYIAENGKVEAVNILENNTGSENLATCMARRIKGWMLPTSGKSVEMSLPFIFTAP